MLLSARSRVGEQLLPETVFEKLRRDLAVINNKYLPQNVFIQYIFRCSYAVDYHELLVP